MKWRRTKGTQPSPAPMPGFFVAARIFEVSGRYPGGICARLAHKAALPDSQINRRNWALIMPLHRPMVSSVGMTTSWACYATRAKAISPGHVMASVNGVARGGLEMT